VGEDQQFAAGPADRQTVTARPARTFLAAMQAERKRAMQTVLRATEQERIRLAADLHDGPVQELTALR
jgi:signal transduction histidine kinase